MHYILKNASVFMNHAFHNNMDIEVKDSRIYRISDPSNNPSQSALPSYDMQGKVVLPGISDSHLHAVNWATRERMLPIREATSSTELLKMLDAHLKYLPTTDRIVYISAWNEENYLDHRVPTIQELDAVSHGHALFISRICGHVGIANSKALEQFPWKSWLEKDPRYIGIDEHGLPNGIVTEDAMTDLFRFIEQDDSAAIKEKLYFSLSEMAKLGICSVGSNDASVEDTMFWSALEAVYAEHPDLPKYYAQVNVSSPDSLLDFVKLRERYADHPSITIHCVKLFKDGSLGGRTAQLIDNYEDANHKGSSLLSVEELREYFSRAYELHVPIAIHAIGDGAIEDILDAYEDHCRLTGESSNPNRHCIIHFQIFNSMQRERVKSLGLLVNSQPAFAHADCNMSFTRLGKARRQEAYDYERIRQTGIIQCFSSDSPVESVNPLLSILQAMQHPAGKPASMTVEDSIEAYTVNNYYFYQTLNRGRIQVGNIADFTIYNVDDANFPSGNPRVSMTIIDGKIVYQNEEQ